MKKRIISFLLSGLLILLTASSLSLFAFADDAVYRLTLNCSVKENGTDRAVAGDEFAVVKIADCVVTDTETTAILSYATDERFADFDCDWAELSSAEMRKKADELCAAVSEGDRADIQTTDSKGKASFELSEPGLYLVVRTKAGDTGITYQPFLISVPQKADGELIYEVSASPKFGNEHITPVAPRDGGSRLPQTGQMFWPIIIFAIPGAALTAAGIYLVRGGKKHEEAQ